jgi:hypothetical protein
VISAEFESSLSAEFRACQDGRSRPSGTWATLQIHHRLGQSSRWLVHTSVAIMLAVPTQQLFILAAKPLSEAAKKDRTERDHCFF